MELKAATHLWGADTWETTEMIQNELGDKGIQVACIGPAGENLVRFVCVIFTLGRAAGMGGTGVEIYRDVALRMAPLRPGDVESMIRGLKAGPLLEGYRDSEPISLSDSPFGISGSFIFPSS